MKECIAGYPVLVIELDFAPPKATSQQKGVMVRGGKARFFEKKRVTDELRMVTEALSDRRPGSPIEGPIALTLEFTYPWRAGDLASGPKRARCERIGWDWHTTKPDAANVAKGIVDRMTKFGYWRDDAQICDDRVTKKRGDRPGLRITIERLSNRA